MKISLLQVFTLLLLIQYGFAQTEILKLKGLQEPVEVIRDKWGVNHIYAKNEHDLFYTQGYCAAKDRIFQFEIWRRQATGTLAEILGPAETKRDIGARLFAYRGSMDKELSHYHPRGKTIIKAYVDGVNTFIDECRSNPRLLPIEFRILGIQPGMWTPEIVVSRHQGIRSNVHDELNFARAIATVGEKKVRELSWFHPLQPDLTIDPSINKDHLFDNILELYDAVNKDVNFSKDHLSKEFQPEGSNNWVLAGNKTASGFPILANDPHRKISAPSLRYIVHLSAPGWDVIGGGEPEIPGVSIGHNQFGAWGLTIFETDAEDLYVYEVNPSNPLQYKFQNGWREMKKIKETIKIKNQKDTIVELYYTHHGPVTFLDKKNNKAYAIKCAWLEPGGAPYLASLRIDQAKDWDSFRDGCSYSHIPGENMIWADKKGNIGWQAVGITPIRTTHSGMVPVPGDGRYEWEGYLPIKDRPHVYNPSNGYFTTSNQHVTSSDYPFMKTISYTWADDFRGDRIKEVLKKEKQATIEKSMALQTDYMSLPSRTLIPLLLNISFKENLINQSKDSLKKWNNILDKNSISASIYVMWEREITEQAKKQFVPTSISNYITIQLSTILKWMVEPNLIFSENPIEKRDEFLKSCFTSAVNKLNIKLGNDISAWHYGQTNLKHILIKHPLSDLVDEKMRQQLNFGPLPRGGYGYSPGANGMADNQSAGASFRMVADLSDWDKAVFTNTPGQSSDPKSPFYKNLFEDWANDKFFPALYSKNKIEAAVFQKTQLLPRK